MTYTPPAMTGRGEMASARVRVMRGVEKSGAPLWPGRLVTNEAKFAVLTATPLRDRGLAYAKGTLGAFGVDSGDVAWLSASPLITGDTTTPHLGEMKEWRDWCLDCITAANVEHVLLMGSGAVGCWRSDVQVGGMELGRTGNGIGLWTVRGRQMIIGVTVSPYAVLGDRTLEGAWQRGIGRWGNIVQEREGLHALGVSCVTPRCGEPVWGYDASGVAWCGRHWRDDGAIKTTKRLYQKVVTDQLEGMEVG